jgi:hypothetical protein
MNTNNKPTMLTTTDNPFNPFTDFDRWYAFDTQQGYNTCGLLARIAVDSPELSEADRIIAIKNAMTSIVELNVFGNHIIVTEDSSRFKKA